MARRLGELPVTKAALQSGALSEDQAAVVCRHCPAANDAAVAEFAQLATVSQLARTLRSYVWNEPGDDEPGDDEAETGAPGPGPERRQVSFGYTEEGDWRISGVLPPDEGAAVDQALVSARRRLEQDQVVSRPCWADALVAMAERSLSASAGMRPASERHTMVVHLRPGQRFSPPGAGQGAGEEGPDAEGPDAEGPGAEQAAALGIAMGAHLHLGPALPDALRRLLGCDGRIKPLFELGGVAVSVGRATQAVPDRTRSAVEDRDGGCRVPGCGRTRWLQMHHIVHWEDGGATDTANVCAMCSAHHRAHHRGLLGIEGNADAPEGLVFTDQRGRRLTGSGLPAPPDKSPPTGAWAHPLGERMDRACVWFRDAPPAA
jgi:hypothetical protein